jgi:hypothetical protein
MPPEGYDLTQPEEEEVVLALARENPSVPER